jgi:hypothetical protein
MNYGAPQTAAAAISGVPAPLAAPSSPQQVSSGEDRRRSQRVLLRVRVDIHVAVQGKSITFDVLTLSVSSHGAMVIMKQSLPIETRLVLEHRGTHERVACKVPRPSRETPEGFHVPLEFDSAAPDFWRVAFPPVDWKPDDL